jgi:hypothetical protein
MISIKVYKQGDDLVIGACDENLLGKKFIEGKFQIDVSKNFYDGKRVDKKSLEKYLNDATIANLVGRETVNCAVELGLIDPDCVMEVKGVPHAQMIRIL